MAKWEMLTEYYSSTHVTMRNDQWVITCEYYYGTLGTLDTNRGTASSASNAHFVLLTTIWDMIIK